MSLVSVLSNFKNKILSQIKKRKTRLKDHQGNLTNKKSLRMVSFLKKQRLHRKRLGDVEEQILMIGIKARQQIR